MESERNCEKQTNGVHFVIYHRAIKKLKLVCSLNVCRHTLNDGKTLGWSCRYVP